MGVFTMPSLGADMEAGTLVEWLVKPGDAVHRGDVVAVVETQKGAIEIECFEDGTVGELKADLGAKLPVGAPLAVIVGPGEAVAEEAPAPKEEAAPAEAPARAPRPESVATPPAPALAPAPAPASARAASPAARVRAKELGISLDGITGSGPGGAVLLADLEAAPARQDEPKVSPQAEMRKAIAAAMTRSKQTIPHFYVSQTIDIQPAQDWLEARNRDRPPAERLLLGALFVRAMVAAAAKVTALNGHFTEGAFRPSEQVNAGIAVALRDGGLVAPALIGAEAMTLDEIMEGMRDLVTRARTGRLRSREMTGGTITLSALGETGAEAMAGVIFPPQVALVGLGAPQVRPWVVEGAVVPRSVVTLTLSADHRAGDGRQAARFISEFETQILSPEKL